MDYRQQAKKANAVRRIANEVLTRHGIRVDLPGADAYAVADALRALELERDALRAALARSELPAIAYRTIDGQEECPLCTGRGPSVAQVAHGSECPVLERRALLGGEA